MTKTRPQKTKFADYDRPPVIETVYGVKFTPLTGWMLPHTGVFWQRISEDFPRVEHAPPIGDTVVAISATGLPLPRVWLISKDDDRLIQLQSGRFLYNWRNREQAGPYPRYETLSQVFFGIFQDFRNFVDDHRLGEVEVLEYELTYINHIVEPQGWKFPEHIGRVMEQLTWQEGLCTFLPRPSTMIWQARFPFLKTSGELLVKLNPAKYAQDDRQLIVLELSARGKPAEAPLDNMEDWFSHAHEWIVRGFEDLTSDEAQKQLWGKHG